MQSFTNFANDTKNDFNLIVASIIIIAISSLAQPIIGVFFTKLFRFSGAIVLAYASIIYITHLSGFYKNNPNIFTNVEYASFKSNIFVGGILSIILTVLILYTTYSVFF